MWVRRSSRARLFHPALHPALNLLVEVTAVLGVEDPVILVRPDQQARRYLHPLQRRPLHQRLVHRNAEVVLSDAQHLRRLVVAGVRDGALIAPHLAVAPRRAEVRQLAMIDPVRGAPLALETRLAGVADDAP